MGSRKSIVLSTVYRVVGMYKSKLDHSSKDNDCQDMFPSQSRDMFRYSSK